MFGSTELSLILLFSLAPFVVGVGLAIYLITLLSRLVRAVEKIAEKQ